MRNCLICTLWRANWNNYSNLMTVSQWMSITTHANHQSSQRRSKCGTVCLSFFDELPEGWGKNSNDRTCRRRKHFRIRKFFSPVRWMYWLGFRSRFQWWEDRQSCNWLNQNNCSGGLYLLDWERGIRSGLLFQLLACITPRRVYSETTRM